MRVRVRVRVRVTAHVSLRLRTAVLLKVFSYRRERREPSCMSANSAAVPSRNWGTVRRPTTGGDGEPSERGWQSPISTSHAVVRLSMRAGAMLCSCRYHSSPAH